MMTEKIVSWRNLLYAEKIRTYDFVVVGVEQVDFCRIEPRILIRKNEVFIFLNGE